jgi:uncharacterized protein DUF4136
MRLSRISMAVGLLLVFFCAAPALAQKVTNDYNHNVDFSNYKTFMWIKEPNTRNPLVQERIVSDVNAALESKGLMLVTSGGDLGVTANAATQEERTLNTFYDNFGGGWRWRWGGGFGTATTTVDRYEVGTLVVDLFDSNSKEAVWRGTSEKTLSNNPEKNAENLNKAVEKMFKDYPPTEHAH